MFMSVYEYMLGGSCPSLKLSEFPHYFTKFPLLSLLVNWRCLRRRRWTYLCLKGLKLAVETEGEANRLVMSSMDAVD